MGKRGKKRGGKKKKAAAAAAAATVADGSAEFFKLQGNAAFGKGDFEEAIRQYTQSIELEDSHATRSNRAAVYMETGAYEEALADAERCVEMAPDWPKGHFRKGNALKALLRMKEALDAFNAGVEIAPENTDLLVAVSDLSRRFKMKDGIISETEEVAWDKFDTLEKWLLDNGAEFPLLFMKKYSELNRGVHAKVRIPGDKTILKIPLPLIITVEMGKESDVGRAMLAARVDLSATKHCYLSIFILMDMQNEDSFYQPYYQILPESYPNMPIFWSPEELEYLTGSYLLQQIRDRKKNIKADYEQICAAAPEFAASVTLERFSWARMVVASRNFGIKVNGRKTDGLVPYADMLNHYRPRETKWTFNTDLDCFTITSLKELEAGQQIYDSYGKKCNSRFLLNYGFAVESNRDPDGKCHNEVRLLFKLHAEDPWRASKIGLLAGLRSERGIRVSMTYTDETTLEAFSFLRFINASDTELMMLPSMEEDPDLGKDPIKPISIDNEIRCLEEMAALMERQLSRYPTTLEQDLEMMEKLEMGSNHRNAVVLLKGEKEVCHFYMELAAVAVPLLGMDWSECKRVINKKHRDESDQNTYIRNVVSHLVKRRPR
eukprot:PLAT6552.1.p2 GENE.PLAT6552.1~~PLAT6552.1.p2  ORF type:complete len:605 (+),score=328.82 PLAT6552.1:124-1938(+)